MDHDERLEIHMKICRQIFERMRREGSWPWREEGGSSDSDNLVELDGNSTDL